MENRSKNANFWILLIILVGLALGTIGSVMRKVPDSQENNEPPFICKLTSADQEFYLVPTLRPAGQADISDETICIVGAYGTGTLRIEFPEGQDTAQLTQLRYLSKTLLEEESQAITPDADRGYTLELVAETDEDGEMLLFILAFTEGDYVFRVDFL